VGGWYVALAEDLVNDARGRCGGVDRHTVVRDVLLRQVESPDELALRWSAAPLVLRRWSSRRATVSRSTRSTNTRSNRSMTSLELRKHPQKKVAGSSWLAGSLSGVDGQVATPLELSADSGPAGADSGAHGHVHGPGSVMLVRT